MAIDWSTTELSAGLAGYNLPSTSDLQGRYTDLLAADVDVSQLFVRLDGLETYVETWDIEAGVWLVVAVVRLVDEILTEYKTDENLPIYGGDPTAEMMILVALDKEQEIVHRLWTAYQELYDILARTQRKAGNRYWHRRATVQNFPQLMIEVEDSDSAEEDPDVV